MSNVLLGTAIGDALGMPFEGLSSENTDLLAWDGESFFKSRPRSPTYYGANMQLDPGQYTDDTIFSLCVAQSLIENNGFDPDAMAKSYVETVFSDINRGYGRTTITALTALKDGTHWSKSGVPGSFGNGTAMRASPFAVYYRNDLKGLIEAVKIDSNMTHKSDEALAGALAIALAVYYTINNQSEDMLNVIADQLPDSHIKNVLKSMSIILQCTAQPSDILKILGTKARVQETVPSAIYCFLKFDNFKEAIVTAIRAGGDTDTTAAIVGALYGAKVGLKGIENKFHAVENFDKLLVLDSQLFSRNPEKLFPVN